jgi:hypothetical protein
MMIIRPFTIITGMLFVLSGATMFVVKHQSQLLEDQLSDTNQATTQDEQSIRVLQAQWALEADPSRLAQLATQFTGLQPMKPGQLMTMAALGTSLPAPGAKPPGDNPEDPVPALPQLAAVTPPPAAPVAPATAPVPVQTAAVVPPAVPVTVPATAPAATQLAAAAPPSTPAPVHVASAAVAPVVHHHVAPERLANATLVHHVTPARHESGSSVYFADASSGSAPVSHGMPMGAQLVPVRAVAAPPPMSADDGGSMLGMAQGGSQ